MKIVITSNTGIEHDYLWQEIFNMGHEVYVFAQTHLRVFQQGGETNKSFKIIRKLFRLIKMFPSLIRNPLFFISKKNAQRKLFKYQTLSLKKYFSVLVVQNIIDKIKTSERYFEFEDINCDAAVRKIAEINPDLIVVHGGKILREDFFGKSRFGTIHLHGGIVPWYRGGNTWYPNIINDDMYYIGPSVQEIDKGIDTGNVIHQHTIKIDSHDNPSSLYCKTVIVGVEILLKCISVINKTNTKIPSTRLSIKGFNYLKRKHIKDYEDIIVYNRFQTVFINFLNSPFTFRPNLIQNKKLMIKHKFVRY
ncbi:MAG: formyl transferase [Patescibacteria group bacterium]|nr:formyl transferase [Patescibacteria group bacterium]